MSKADSPRRKRIREVIDHPNVRAFLDMIAAAEIGDDSLNGAGYDVAFGRDKRFTDFSKHPGISDTYVDKSGKRRRSTAAGRYQFLEGTYKDLAKRYGFTDFSPRTQDEMAIALAMDAKALDDILRGDINAALPKLGTRWASLHTSDAGRRLHGTRTSDFVYDAWNKALERHKSGTAPAAPPAGKGVVQTALHAVRPENLPDLKQLSPTILQTVPALSDVTVPPFPFRRTAAVGAQRVREMLQQRYSSRRPLAISPKALTPELADELMRTVLAPPDGTPIHPGPSEHSAHTDRTKLIQQLPTDRFGEPVKLLPETQFQPAPNNGTVPDVTPEAPLFVLQPPGPVIPDTPDTGITVTALQDGLVNMLQPVGAETAGTNMITPSDYLDAQLRNAQQGKNFLDLSFMDIPQSRALLELIDNTKVQPLG